VKWEHDEVTINLKLNNEARSSVSLTGNYYITSWEMYDAVRPNFLWCEEKGCAQEPLASCRTFRQHLQRHAMTKVIRLKGETEENYKARQGAAGEAKILEPKYLEKMENYMRLDGLVKAAAERRLRRL